MLRWLLLWIEWWFFLRPVSLTIRLKRGSRKMNEGASAHFEVVATNKLGREIKDARPIAVAVDNPALFSSFAYDAAANDIAATAGGVDGTATLTATDGVLTAPPFPITVTPDNEVAALAIRPKA